MIPVYICEDNPQHLQLFTETIHHFLLFEPLNEMLAFAAKSPKELLQHLEHNPAKNGLYFLDILFKGDMNGLVLAQELRKRDPLGMIVFITSHSEMSYMTFSYHVEALDFILKDRLELVPGKMTDCLRAADDKMRQIDKLSSRPAFIRLHGEQLPLDIEDITCIETVKDAAHKIHIYTKSGIQSTYGTLKELETALSSHPEFFRCHKSFIVNKNHIQKLDNKSRLLYLDTGKVCPVSVRSLRALKK